MCASAWYGQAGLVEHVQTLLLDVCASSPSPRARCRWSVLDSKPASASLWAARDVGVLRLTSGLVADELFAGDRLLSLASR